MFSKFQITSCCVCLSRLYYYFSSQEQKDAQNSPAQAVRAALVAVAAAATAAVAAAPTSPTVTVISTTPRNAEKVVI